MSAIILPGIAAQELPAAGGFPIPAIANRGPSSTSTVGTLRKTNAKGGARTTDGFSIAYYGATFDFQPTTDLGRVVQIGDNSGNPNYSAQILFYWAQNGLFRAGFQAWGQWFNNAFTFDTTTWRATEGVPHHCVFSADVLAGTATCMIDGNVEALSKTGAGSGFQMDWGPNNGSWALFCRHNTPSVTPGWHEKLGFITVSDTIHDLNQASERDRFWDSAQGLPINPDTDAANLFGAASRFCIFGDQAEWRAGNASGIAGFFNQRTDTASLVDDGTVEVI